MASTTPSDTLDDFVVLEPNRRQELPLRQRPCHDEAERDIDSFSTDDELEHISSPGSVRSLGTLSPSPSVVRDDLIASSPILQLTESSSTHEQAVMESNGVQRTSRNGFRLNTPLIQIPEPATYSLMPSLAYMPCHDHQTIDHQVMDLLIENALNARIEKDLGNASPDDRELRRQMMARYRSLPAEHFVVQKSMAQMEGSKILYPGQCRSMSEVEFIYHNVFTPVEHMALNFLAECHMRHFEISCSFYGSFMPRGRDRLFEAMLQPGASKGKDLALNIQMTVLQRLDINRAFKNHFDGLRRQTRSRVDFLPVQCLQSGPQMNTTLGDHMSGESGGAMDAMDINQWRLAVLRQVFLSTIENLPNKNYQSDDPVDTASAVSLKRENPEDESEQHSAALNLPNKKPTLATRTTARDYECHSVIPSAVSQTFPSCYETPSFTKVTRQPLEQVQTRLSSQRYENLTRIGILRISHKIAQMEAEDRQARLQSSIYKTVTRGPFEMPHAVCLVVLGEQCRSSRERAKESASNHNNHASPCPRHQQPPVESDPYFQPAGFLSETFKHLNCDGKDKLLSKHEKAWICQYIMNKSTLGWPVNKDMTKVVSDSAIAQHVNENGLGFADYYYRMEAMMMIKCMRLLTRRGYLLNHATIGCQQQKETRISLERDDQSEGDKASRSNSTVFNDHFSAQSRIALSGADSPTREYRQDTLLAQSTQLPAEIGSCSFRMPLSNFGTNLDGNAGMAAQKKPQWGNSFAPAMRAHDSDKTLKTWKDRSILLEGNRERGGQQNLENQVVTQGDRLTKVYQESWAPLDTLPFRTRRSTTMADRKQPGQTSESHNELETWTTSSSPPQQVSNTFVDSRATRTFYDAVSSKMRSAKQRQAMEPASQASIHQQDYEEQLRLLELANRRRLFANHEEQIRLLDGQNVGRHMAAKQQAKSGGSDEAPYQCDAGRSESDSTPKSPALVQYNGTDWMQFEFEQSRVKMEYCVRADVDSVDTDKMTLWFKDTNYIHAVCEGWRAATQAQTRRFETSQTELESHVDEQREPESPGILRKKAIENKLAWSLAELNPCLRGKRDLLRTAVMALSALRPEHLGMETPKLEGSSRRAEILLTTEQIMHVC